MNEDTNEGEELQPLFGAVGPYLSFSTGHMSPIEDYPEDAGHLPMDNQLELVYPEDDADSDTDFWEDDEQ